MSGENLTVQPNKINLEANDFPLTLSSPAEYANKARIFAEECYSLMISGYIYTMSLGEMKAVFRYKDSDTRKTAVPNAVMIPLREAGIRIRKTRNQPYIQIWIKRKTK